MLLRSFFSFVPCQKMLINRIYLLVILLTGWVQVDLTGQESMLKGRVLDAATGDAVVGANVFDPIRQTGTFTDQKGEFTIMIPQWPVRLEVSSIGYEKFLLDIFEREEEGITIYLSPVSTDLPEVNVTAAKVATEVYAGPVQVLDFLFYGENILTLIRNRDTGQEAVEWRSAQGFLIDSLPLALKGKGEKSLHQSCLGTVSIIAGGKVYQLVMEEDVMLGYLPAGDYHTYFWEVEKCQLAYPDRVCYQLYRYLGQQVDYRMFLRGQDSSYVFYSVANEQRIRQLFDDMAPKILLDRTAADMTATHPDDLREIRNAQEDLDGWKHLFYQPVYCPVFGVGDKIAVFDHVHGELRFFTASGQALSSLPISYHLQENWGREVLLDEITGKFYTVFATKQGKQLNEIQRKDGSLGEPVLIKSNTIRKLGVLNGILYFLEENKDAVFGFTFLRLKKIKIGLG